MSPALTGYIHLTHPPTAGTENYVTYGDGSRPTGKPYSTCEGLPPLVTLDITGHEVRSANFPPVPRPLQPRARGRQGLGLEARSRPRLRF